MSAGGVAVLVLWANLNGLALAALWALLRPRLSARRRRAADALSSAFTASDRTVDARRPALDAALAALVAEADGADASGVRRRTAARQESAAPGGALPRATLAGRPARPSGSAVGAPRVAASGAARGTSLDWSL